MAATARKIEHAKFGAVYTRKLLDLSPGNVTKTNAFALPTSRCFTLGDAVP